MRACVLYGARSPFAVLLSTHRGCGRVLSTEGEGSPVDPLPKAPFLLLPTFTACLALAFPPVLSPDCTYTHCEAASLPPSFLAASMP